MSGIKRLNTRLLRKVGSGSDSASSSQDELSPTAVAEQTLNISGPLSNDEFRAAMAAKKSSGGKRTTLGKPEDSANIMKKLSRSSTLLFRSSTTVQMRPKSQIEEPSYTKAAKEAREATGDEPVRRVAPNIPLPVPKDSVTSENRRPSLGRNATISTSTTLAPIIRYNSRASKSAEMDLPEIRFSPFDSIAGTILEASNAANTASYTSSSLVESRYTNNGYEEEEEEVYEGYGETAEKVPTIPQGFIAVSPYAESEEADDDVQSPVAVAAEEDVVVGGYTFGDAFESLQGTDAIRITKEEFKARQLSTIEYAEDFFGNVTSNISKEDEDVPSPTYSTKEAEEHLETQRSRVRERLARLSQMAEADEEKVPRPRRSSTRKIEPVGRISTHELTFDGFRALSAGSSGYIQSGEESAGTSALSEEASPMYTYSESSMLTERVQEPRTATFGKFVHDGTSAARLETSLSSLEATIARFAQLQQQQ